MPLQINELFPSLQREHNDQTLIFLDGPAGSQVPESVIDAMSNYYRTSNANKKGYFITAQETDKMLASVRQKMAIFLGAEGAHTISFGANMTSLTYPLARAIGTHLQPGDEILITQLDHEANRDPWLVLRKQGIIVREVSIKKDGTLDYEDFKQKINERTRLVAMGYASNIFGTVNDVKLIRKWTYKVGAWLLLDAVHSAPHLPTNVQELGCDFLLCSAYKFYGPHVGILYARPGLLDRLPIDCLRTAPQNAPYSIESGTQNHAALAGVGAAIDFIASLGKGETYTEQLGSGIGFIQKKEHKNVTKLYKGLKSIPGIQLYGPSLDVELRAPTLAFTVEGKTAAEVCQYLATRNICAWSGHFYAVRTMEVLGLLEKGGVVRMGIMIYNTEEEIEFVIDVLRAFALS